MTAPVKPSRLRLTREHHEQFLRMLPAITRTAQIAFRDRDPESREEATAEVIAAAYAMFVGLVQTGREALAYASPLAAFGIKHVKIGRKEGTKLNCKDVSSEYARLKKGVVMERLDRYDRDTQSWLEILVEDRHAGPAETAIARIDIGEWSRSLPPRDRKIARFLSVGHTTGQAARRFKLSPGRISQKRREYLESWQAFQGEGPHTDHDVAA